MATRSYYYGFRLQDGTLHALLREDFGTALTCAHSLSSVYEQPITVVKRTVEDGTAYSDVTTVTCLGSA